MGTFERLQEIKKMVEAQKQKYKYDTNLVITLKECDIRWLIAQADKVEYYQRELRNITQEGCSDPGCLKGEIATRALIHQAMTV